MPVNVVCTAYSFNVFSSFPVQIACKSRQRDRGRQRLKKN